MKWPALPLVDDSMMGDKEGAMRLICEENESKMET
jgi:hypothetical protein